VLETAILQSQLWTQWTPYETPDPSILTDAAQLMFTRYTSHGSAKDLDDIIALHRRVLHSMSSQGVRHFVSLNDLGEALSERWYQCSQMDNIEESISLFEEALGLCAIHDERRAIILGNLAQALVYLSMQSFQVSRSSSAISLLREALSIAPLHNDVMAALSIRLSGALVGYYLTREGKIGHLQEAIDVARSATSLLPIGHRYRPDALECLARALERMLEKEAGTEANNHWEEIRLLFYRALEAQSPTHPHRARCLSLLGYILGGLPSNGTFDRADLDEGIRLIQEAMTLVTPSHVIYRSVLNVLGYGLAARFQFCDKNQKDIDYSITIHEQAMNTTALSHAGRYNYVLNLASALDARHMHFNDPEDLRRAISLGREALVLCPPGHHDHTYSVFTLSRRLIRDPNCLITDIDKMVGFVEAILEHENKSEANSSGFKANHLSTMACLLHARFLRLSNPEDRARSAMFFEAAIQDESSGFGYRFEAAKRWISAAETLDSPDMAMEAYRMAIHISPHRVYPGLDPSSQLDQLKRNFATVSCDAACCALVTSDASEALTLLEQGRATFWAQRLQLRMSFDALPSDLAERLRVATKKLQEDHLIKKVHSASGRQRLLDQRLHHETFQQLLREARLYPDFTDFLRPIQTNQLEGLAKNGPLIVLLSSKTYGSFAIIVQGCSSNVKKLSLSPITALDLQAMVEDLQVSVHQARQEMQDAASKGHERLKLEKRKPGPKEDAMARLWSQVGEPIMRHLGIEVSTQQPKAVTRPAAQRAFSDARRLTLGREYGGAAPAYSLRCPSMQLEYQVPTQYTCQITSYHHTHRPSAVLSKRENTRILLQRRLR
jgi:tetratricopeptide (TPR) repeat protein/outer membrane murein-binding lipoprotein Lpp